jgi:hypothetical protein
MSALRDSIRYFIRYDGLMYAGFIHRRTRRACAPQAIQREGAALPAICADTDDTNTAPARHRDDTAPP